MIKINSTTYGDGKNYDKNKLNHLWSDISYVPQNSFLLDDTIVSNVCFGIHKKQINKSRLKTALKISQLDNFINNLPNKIDTIVGEKGVQISGGQRQRICIARAIYQNRKFIFFDEAMSALDEITENKIMNSLMQLKGKTILLITHRLDTISKFDNVYILKNKKILKK
jgi:ABC-type multidrug transport system fused ATPase/permease subunit